MPVASRKSRGPQLRARLLFVAYALRLLAPRLFVMGALTVGGGLIVRARTATPDGKPLPLLQACYDVYTQLYFEHTSPLPTDPVLQALYFVVPLVGALVLAEGLFKLGASLLDFRNHRDAWMRIMAKTYRDHIVLVGLGNVGFRVLEELLARDCLVAVCESRDEGPFVEEARARGVPLLIGDARRESLLKELGVEHARAVIACTDNDLVNLEVAVDSRALNPKVRLVMRMFDQSLAQKIGNTFQLQSSFSTSALAAPVFAAAALDERVHGAYRLGDTMMVSVEMPIAADSPLRNRSIHEIEETLGVPVIGIHRAGREPTHRFARTETLQRGDAVICHVPADDVEALRGRCSG